MEADRRAMCLSICIFVGCAQRGKMVSLPLALRLGKESRAHRSILYAYHTGLGALIAPSLRLFIPSKLFQHWQDPKIFALTHPTGDSGWLVLQIFFTLYQKGNWPHSFNGWRRRIWRDESINGCQQFLGRALGLLPTAWKHFDGCYIYFNLNNWNYSKTNIARRI